MRNISQFINVLFLIFFCNNVSHAQTKKIKNVPERIGDRLDALETKIEEILDRLK